VSYALERYQKESERLYGVLNSRLTEVEYLAGQCGIADMATWGWAARHEALGISLTGYPHVARWLKQVGQRPAVQRALALKP
jgi:GST-like protein